MHTNESRRCLALSAAFILAAPSVRAEWITPDSIPNPPAAVSSANGTPVYSSNLVDSQYASMGLTFNSLTAITHLNGASVWAPVGAPYPPPGNNVGSINYYRTWNEAYFNSFTARANMTVSSLTVETMGNSGQLALTVFGLNGDPLKITPLVQNISGSNGEKIWRFTGSGIYAFSAVLAPPPITPDSGASIDPAWGIAAVSFAPNGQTPEPSSLVLAGLGALALTARFGRRRIGGEIA